MGALGAKCSSGCLASLATIGTSDTPWCPLFENSARCLTMFVSVDAYASFAQFIHSRDCRIYMVSLCQTLLYIQWCRCYVWRMWPKKWLCLWRLGWLEHPPLVLHQWLSNFGLEFLRLFEKSNIMIGSCIVSNFWNVSWNYYSCTRIREVKFSPVTTSFWIKEKRRLHCMVIVENSGRGKRKCPLSRIYY